MYWPIGYIYFLLGVCAVINTTGEMFPRPSEIEFHGKESQHFAHCSSMLYSTGPPESLVVTPDGEDITVENNSPLQIQVQVQDKAGNLTVQPRLNVVCKVHVAVALVIFTSAVANQYQPRTALKTSL